MRLVLPEENGAVIRRFEAAAVDRALEELRPDQRRVLATFSVPGNRDIDDHNLAGENVVWTQVGSAAEELADL